jgi:diguanylate cyclase (GGDEF)-like protein
MSSPVSELVALTRELRGKQGLETLLQTIAEHAARIIGTTRVSIRLLDPQRTRLLASARAGEPLHKNPVHEFPLGEGLVGWIALHAQPLRAGRAEEDPRFQHRPDMKEQMGSFVGVPILADLDCLGVLSAVHPSPDHFGEEHQELLELLAALSAPYLEIARLARLTHIDPLTGAYNRNALEALIETRATLSVAMVDVDHFKEVNDRHGHPVGDEVLRRLTKVVASVLRPSDAVVRYGGEEFLLVLPEVSLAEAQRIAERARAAVELTAFMVVPSQVTISLGIAEHLPGETVETLLSRADEALYRAKKSGRNRVEVAP